MHTHAPAGQLTAVLAAGLSPAGVSNRDAPLGAKPASNQITPERNHVDPPVSLAVHVRPVLFLSTRGHPTCARIYGTPRRPTASPRYVDEPIAVKHLEEPLIAKNRAQASTYGNRLLHRVAPLRPRDRACGTLPILDLSGTVRASPYTHLSQIWSIYLRLSTAWV